MATDDAIAAPRETTDLIGHQPAERILLDAWTSGRLPHAWIFAGPRGIGKATLAYRFARFILAAGSETAGGLFGPPDSLHIDPDHPVFRRVAAGGHLDLLALEKGRDDKGKPRTRILVDQVRKVGRFLRLTPAEGGWRVVILDSADDLNTNAANALLKILEEPPERAILMLVAHAPGRILPTIRSRCRTLALQPLSDGQVSEVLRSTLGDLNEDQAATLAALAEGSPGRALALASHGGLELYQGLAALAASAPNLEHAASRSFAAGAAKSDTAWQTGGELIEMVLADTARVAAGAAPRHSHDPDWLPGLARRAPAESWVALWRQAHRLWRLADSVHLDRQQVAMDVLGLLRNVSAHGRLSTV